MEHQRISIDHSFLALEVLFEQALPFLELVADLLLDHPVDCFIVIDDGCPELNEVALLLVIHFLWRLDVEVELHLQRLLFLPEHPRLFLLLEFGAVGPFEQEGERELLHAGRLEVHVVKRLLEELVVVCEAAPVDDVDLVEEVEPL